MNQMSKSHKARTLQAIRETREILSEARKYSPEYQDTVLINFCENHIANLLKMLEGE